MVNSAPLDTQNDNETTADDPDPAFVIDVSTFEKSGKSFPYALSSRICETCPGCETIAADEDSKPPRTPSELMRHIAQNCSQQPDYLLSSTPITEAVFRLLIANSNRPMKPEQDSVRPQQRVVQRHLPQKSLRHRRQENARPAQRVLHRPLQKVTSLGVARRPRIR